MQTQEEAFLATIKERYCLNPGSDKETYHLVLDLSGSGIEYKVGDCLGIFPQNDPSTVYSLIQNLASSPEAPIQDRKGRHFLLGEFLLKHANLGRLPEELDLTPLSFCQKLSPMMPRFYSIASSMEEVGEEAHLTVGVVPGVCSHYLCKQLELGKSILPVFHHPSRNFSLPQASDDKPIIMVGPGTGIAPFRGFMQERLIRNKSAKNWLFFGERHQQTDFYYKNFWEMHSQKGQLSLDCAFSRDQKERIYVQHLMRHKGEELWKWIEQGAYIYVCGDASKMAKDVDQTLHHIAEKYGALSAADAKTFFKTLRKSKRYQRDVY